jgi:sugar phosphate isomerase/epimerase
MGMKDERVQDKPIIGMQMYSLRDEAEIDFLGTLEKVAEIGYKAVELTGFFNVPAKELKNKLKILGLSAPSAHIPLNFNDMPNMLSEFSAQLEYAKEVGFDFIITPWAPLPEEPLMDDVKHLVDVFTKCGLKVKEMGMKYGFHNHEDEFKLIEGKTVLEHLMEQMPKELMTLELDLGWVHMAGYEPDLYIHKFKDRIKLIHAKDFTDGRKDIEVGRGKVGYDKLIRTADSAGIAYIFVEQEQFEVNSLESARVNFDYFRKLGYV